MTRCYRPKRPAWTLLLSLLVIMAIVCGESSDNERIMECVASDEDNTVVCVFTIDREEQDVELEHCSEEFCVKAAVTTENVSDGEDSMQQQEETSPDVDEEADDHSSDVITVGSFYFEAPFDQHGDEVALVLERHPKNLGKEPTTVRDTLLRANWYNDLGKAYRDDVKEDDMTSTTFLLDAGESNVCIQTFSKAVALYEKVLASPNAPKGSRTLRDARHEMALAHTFLGETLQFHPSDPQPEEALKHYLAAQENFKILLATKGLSRADHEQYEMTWAENLSHAAVLMLDDANDMDPNAMTVSNMLQHSSKVAEKAKKAEAFLEDAAQVFRKAVATSAGQARIVYKSQLANTLHNMGAASLLMVSPSREIEEANNSPSRAIEAWEEARTLFLELSNESKTDEVIAGMAEVLISLADGYLQAGNYDDSKVRYREAMDWYEEHNLAPPVDIVLPIESTGGLLEATEAKLEEYHAELYGGSNIQVPDDYQRPGEPIYEPDDLYEADLHASIGALQMSAGQTELALTHLVKAIDLYENSGHEERAIADTKLNMSMALFRLGEYDESATVRDESLELYRELIGEGKNPLALETMDLEDMLDEAVNVDFVKGDANEGDTPDDEQPKLVNIDLQQTLSNLTKDEL